MINPVVKKSHYIIQLSIAQFFTFVKLKAMKFGIFTLMNNSVDLHSESHPYKWKIEYGSRGRSFSLSSHKALIQQEAF